MKDIFLMAVSGLLVAVVLVWAFIQATSTPDVIFDYPSGRCLKVINADGSAGTCGKLPAKYNHVWGRAHD